MRNIKFKLALVLSFFSLLAGPTLVVASAGAAPLHQPVFATSKEDACAGIGLTGGNCGANAGNSISKVIKAIINILSSVIGVVAVIMVIIGGFKYITSGGDSNKVASAKSTITYAIVGLVVVALAQILVHFVIKTAAS